MFRKRVKEPKFALGCIPSEHDDRDKYISFNMDGTAEIYQIVNGQHIHLETKQFGVI